VSDPIFNKLVGCFENVFPELPKGAIPAATHDNVTGWDSLAQVTLLTLIAEEFELDIDFGEFEGATSFATLLPAVREKSVHGR
jgi:acyl carrier protein